MRDRIVLAAGLVASAGVAALLMLPRILHPPPELKRRAALPPQVVEPIVVAPPAPTIVPSASAGPRPVASAQPPTEACPSDMQLVHGPFCPFVAHKCRKKRKDTGTCEEFADEVLCEGTIRDARFCIDRFEYPNLEGVKPAVLVTWSEARRACEVEGKRLCSADEWQFACEGSAIFPLPEGLRRDGGCNVDRPDPSPLFGTMASPFEFARELMRVDGRAASGEREACTSPFGVRDMAGNVGEWIDNTLGNDGAPPFRSSIAGGSFGPLEASCRTLDASNPDNVRSHRVGFRCCSDAGPRAPGDQPIPSRRSPGGFRPIGPR